jgi:hypothetical protein
MVAKSLLARAWFSSAMIFEPCSWLIPQLITIPLLLFPEFAMLHVPPEVAAPVDDV